MIISHTRCVKSSAQLALDLSTPGLHAESVHAGVRHGTVLIWEQQKAKRRWTKIQPCDDLMLQMSGLAGRHDAFMSINEFHSWRRVELLRSLRAVYVDIDWHADIDGALDALHTARMPAPSFAVYSGRGLHLYWLLEATPAKALPVWQRIQDALITAVQADPACRDCTRVLRLAGTLNSRNEEEVRGLMLSGVRWTLHELADEVLGHRKVRPPKSRVLDLAAGAARQGRRPVAQGSIYAWWHTVYQDMHTIIAHIGGRAPVGSMDTLLFVHAVALSWFAQPDALTDEIAAIGHRITDFSDADITRVTSTVVQRAVDAKAGKTVEWQGKQRDPRYAYRAATLRSLLAEPLARVPTDALRALCPADVIARRKQERDAARWGDHNTGTGVRQGNADKRAQARAMRLEGASIREIGVALGVAIKTVQRWIS